LKPEVASLRHILKNIKISLFKDEPDPDPDPGGAAAAVGLPVSSGGGSWLFRWGGQEWAGVYFGGKLLVNDLVYYTLHCRMLTCPFIIRYIAECWLGRVLYVTWQNVDFGGKKVGLV